MPAYVRPTKQIALRLTLEMHGWLEKVAKEQDRSLAYVIKRIIAAEMEREAKKAKRERSGSRKQA